MLVNAALYRDGHRIQTVETLAAIRDGCTEPDTFAWIGLFEPDEAEFNEVRDIFGLHELAVRDALARHHRPTLERYDDTWLLVVKTATYVDPQEVVDIGEIRVFFGETFVVAVRYGEASPMAAARAELESRPDLLRLGAGAAIYTLLDTVIENYIPVLDGLDNDIDEVEAQVFSDDRDFPTQRIYQLNREVLGFQRGVSPLRGPIDDIVSGKIDWIPTEVAKRLVDLRGNLARIIEQIEEDAKLLHTVLEANLTQVNIQQNDDMRKISAWVAMAAIPAAIGGIYGMNFTYIPFANHDYGFVVVLGIMALSMLYLWSRFKRSGWV
ncbi:MAG: magnesium and cobalt transport protein CorA [Acidimicrobiales bacterium]|nr:magnesium and cobalt transport protein CorA [Acidimicrobiales bacterium]